LSGACKCKNTSGRVSKKSLRQMRTYKFELASLNIAKSQIEKVMNYVPGNSPDPFSGLIDEVLDNAHAYCSIEGGYIIRDDISFDTQDNVLNIGTAYFSVKKIVFSQIKKSEKIALFLCTAGPLIGEWSKKLMAGGETLKGYVVDVVGSEVVETAMDKIQDDLQAEMKQKGLFITNRYSPGYCGWDVSEQQKLFSFFPANFCSIKLSETSLMHPVKSVSGVIGIGKDVRKKNYPCRLCDDKNCIYRGKRFSV
jgi:hypothetical protein